MTRKGISLSLDKPFTENYTLLPMEKKTAEAGKTD